MKNSGIVLALSTVVVLLTVFSISRCDRKIYTKKEIMRAHIRSLEDLKNLFPKSAKEIAQLTDECIERTKKEINTLISIPAEKRTFKNTAFAFDRLEITTDMEIFGNACATLKEVSPDAPIRKACREAVQKLSEFSVDWMSNNVEFYKAFKEYVDGNAKTEKLRPDQKYFLEEVMKGFRRAGLDLPENKRELVKKIKKELIDLSLQFSTNVATDNRVLTLERKDLAGMSNDFIDALKKNDSGKYIVPVNMPNYFAILESCSVEETRKQIYRNYKNRAYPKNVPVLEKIFALRDELAKILGYKSFAHYSLEEQMMKSPENVTAFLDDLRVKLVKKNKQEFDVITKKLPEGMILTKEGKMNLWDQYYAYTSYKKANLDVDDVKLSEYFQLENTLDSMFKLFSDFFGVRYEQVETDDFWHPEVKLVKVYDKDSGDFISYMLLDLHPRDNKYGHAAHFGILPGIKAEKKWWPGLSLIVANFPKSTKTKPSLLKREEVKTLFHEFGHAMHHILGRTKLAFFAGTSVKRDFVEVPSQLLEEWMWNPQSLKKISKHYKTGEAISDKQIESILKLRQFDRGWHWLRQSVFAYIALAYHAQGAQKDLQQIWNDIYEKVMPTVAYDPGTHGFASFGHLVGYHAAYYSYIWSRMLTQDVFDHINKQGLFSKDAGDRYVEIILNSGGSKHPDQLLKEFLGREPNDKAFFDAIGLN